MKKFTIKKQQGGKWLAAHNEHPRFTCLFEDKKFHYERTAIGPIGQSWDLEQIQLLEKMEKWLSRYHKEKING